MTRSEFRNLIVEFVRVEGQPYIDLSDTASLNSLINERLPIFSGLAKAFYDDKISLTLTGTATPGPLSVPLRDFSYVGKFVWEPVQVFVNGLPLVDFTGNMGAVSALQIGVEWPRYLTEPAGVPRHWYLTSPETGIALNVWPAPSTTPTNCFVQGFTMHPAMTADSGAGGTILLPSDLYRAAAKFVAADLLDPRKSGSSEERYMMLMKEASGEAEEWAAKVERQLGGRRVVGVRRGWRQIGR